MAQPSDPITAAHEMAKAQFEKLDESYGHVKALREGLDGLMKLGDLVAPEDVVKTAASLVAKGFSPQEMAVLLSDMPAGGEPLQQWLQMHDMGLRKMEQNAGQIMNTARHALGVTAAHVVMKDHVEGAAPPAPPSPSPAMTVGPGPGSLNINTPTAGNA